MPPIKFRERLKKSIHYYYAYILIISNDFYYQANVINDTSFVVSGSNPANSY